MFITNVKRLDRKYRLIQPGGDDADKVCFFFNLVDASGLRIFIAIVANSRASSTRFLYIFRSFDFSSINNERN